MKQSLKTIIIIRILVTILVFLPAVVFARESSEKENPTLEFSYLKKQETYPLHVIQKMKYWN